MIEISESCGIPQRAAALTRYYLYTADECFMTGTGAEIMPVTKIDGRPVGDGRPVFITKRFTDCFRNLVLQNNL